LTVWWISTILVHMSSANDGGAEIRAEMGRQRVSMIELSRRTGKPRRTLSDQINSGRITVDYLVAIAEALGVEPSALIASDIKASA